MRNVCFFWNQDPFDKAVLEASASVEKWPVSNLQNPLVGLAWKCPDGSGFVKVSFDIPRMVSALVIVGHNLVVGSTVEVVAYDDAFTNATYSQSFNVIQPVYTARELPFCNSSMLGYPSQEDLEILPRTTTVLMLEESQCRRCVKVNFNNLGEPFHVGRMFLTHHFMPQENFQYNWGRPATDDSIITKSLGGQIFVDDKKMRRGLNFTLSGLTEGEVYGPLEKLIHHVKKSRPFVTAPVPDDPVANQYSAIYGFLSTIPNPIQTTHNRYSANFNIMEAL